MSSKTSNQITDNYHHNVIPSLPSSVPMDNQILSLNSEYNQHEIINGMINSLMENGNNCDNSRPLEHMKADAKGTCFLDDSKTNTPQNARKFSPDNIKGKILNAC